MKNRDPFAPLIFEPKSVCHPGLLLSAVLFCGMQAFAQTPISGIINNYYSVVEVLPAKSCLRLNSTAGLAYNDKVMIIQMKGASINTSNNSSFGDTTTLNNAGNYEIATVCSTNGDSVFFVYTLLNQYTVSGKVQVVRIPQYVSATVIDTVKAMPWNNALGRGGVLAMIVENDLTLNSHIYADSIGFRGGEYRLSNGTCSNFFPADAFYYDANNLSPQDGSFKGEGVSDVLAAQSGGKGAPANGGGGGNNHNNGGGGGANLSAGGISGGNSSSVGCRVSNQGLGGKALSSYNGKKIFAGGGGGAGHSNFALANAVGGGNGGGIVFIEAGSITGNGRKIMANGRVGGASLGDGASGGGAAGTVILDVGSYAGALTIQANGGQGGTANDGGNVGRCYGAGGGGSGGAIYFTGSTPAVTINANAGAAGPEVGREATCNAAIPSAAGAAGQIIAGYTVRSSTTISTNSCGLILPLRLISFKALLDNGSSVYLKWEIADPENAASFVVERSVNAVEWNVVEQKSADEKLSYYQAVDLSPHWKENFYRLKIIGRNNEISYSRIQKVYLPLPADAITIFPNPASKTAVVNSTYSFSTLTLYDLNGKMLMQKKLGSNPATVTIDLSELAEGVYLLKADNAVKKLVVRK